MNRAEAEAHGFVVDTCCYPWVAYKGPRFQPESLCYILTDKEHQLELLAKETKARFDQMNELEVPPLGDDYNDLFDNVRHRAVLAGVWHEQG